jgi:hypothetical protein
MKKTIVLLIVLLLLMQSVYAIPSTWAQREVVKLKLQGVLEGDLANDQKMKQPITREEFAQMAVKLYLKATNQVIEGIATTHPFTDTQNPYVGAAYRLNIVNGISQTRFDPKAHVTREQIATMLHRELTEMGLAKGYQSATPFADQGQISSWAIEGVAFSRFHGLVQGVGNNRFAPKDPATREQVYKLIDNILVKYKLGADYQLAQTQTQTLNGFTIPRASQTQLVIGDNVDQGIVLRIQSGVVSATREPLNMTKQWLEVYDTVASHSQWGYTPAVKLVEHLKDNWQLSSLSYTSNAIYYLLPTGVIQQAKPVKGPYIQISYRSILTLDIYN